MKKTNQKFLILLSLLLITSSSLILNVNAATVGDTSVGAEVGDIYTYVVVEADEKNTQVGVGDKLEVKIDSISPLVNGMQNGYLNVNITMRSYNKTSDSWTIDLMSIEFLVTMPPQKGLIELKYIEASSSLLL